MASVKRYLLLVMVLGTLFSCNEPGSVNVKIGDSSSLDSVMDWDNESVRVTIMKKSFGTIDNQPVYLFTLRNMNGMTVKITNYGGIVTSIMMPDKEGHSGDIVLGYDSLNGYLKGSPYFGAIVGRYANRIAKGRFTLDGKTYKLAVNNGNNALHGGIKGFDKVVWNAEVLKDSTRTGVLLTYLSKDGEEGYPGNLTVKIIYTLDNHNVLTFQVEAVTDKATPINICNHSYFNLSEADTSVLGHYVNIYADRYTEVNGELIPTGNLPGVRGSAMDFNNAEAIGSRIAMVKGGYDHNYVLRKTPGTLSLAAQVYDPRSGRQLEIFTTQPGVQFYTGNFLDGSFIGKGGKRYDQHYGFCLETQHFPDSPNQPSFPGVILRPGETYKETTCYHFSVLK
ncbi:MAG TPA: aldose epimerase family protein [Bacteroidales bacterium]|nr:aldose epimerase family protein [Bacteroidales bacterium]